LEGVFDLQAYRNLTDTIGKGKEYRMINAKRGLLLNLEIRKSNNFLRLTAEFGHSIMMAVIFERFYYGF